MSENEQRAVFSKNLNRYLSISEKNQKEVADAIGVSPQTFNTWCKGIALPRMSKVQLLADYFGIQKSDLLEEKHDSYYMNPETASWRELDSIFSVVHGCSNPRKIKRFRVSVCSALFTVVHDLVPTESPRQQKKPLFRGAEEPGRVCVTVI